MEFTGRFNQILKDNHINQAKLADDLGVSRQAITNLKNGASLPSLYLLFNICKYLDVSADYLLGLSDY